MTIVIEASESLALWIEEARRRGRWFRVTFGFSHIQPRWFTGYAAAQPIPDPPIPDAITERTPDWIEFRPVADPLENTADYCLIEATDPVRDRFGNSLYWWEGDPVLSGPGHILFARCSCDGWEDFVARPIEELFEEFLESHDNLPDYRSFFEWLEDCHFDLVAQTISEEEASPGCDSDAQFFFTSLRSPDDPVWKNLLTEFLNA